MVAPWPSWPLQTVTRPLQCRYSVAPWPSWPRRSRRAPHSLRSEWRTASGHAGWPHKMSTHTVVTQGDHTGCSHRLVTQGGCTVWSHRLITRSAHRVVAGVVTSVVTGVVTSVAPGGGVCVPPSWRWTPPGWRCSHSPVHVIGGHHYKWRFAGWRCRLWRWRRVCHDDAMMMP